MIHSNIGFGVHFQTYWSFFCNRIVMLQVKVQRSNTITTIMFECRPVRPSLLGNFTADIVPHRLANTYNVVPSDDTVQ